ncbi:hypothetical protein ABW21_db0206263 [Orbilia brochopaga]|nr:hypothetical protein ABW21_db0206263 [Drechslerella brochopaga]
MSSNIRVFVSFGDKAAVFAGEDIECTITFRNIAPAPGSQRSGSRSVNGSILENGPEHKGFSERRSKQPPLQLAAAEKSASARKQRPGSISTTGAARKHRPSLSLSTPGSARRLQQQQGTPLGSPATTVRPITATTQGSAVEATAGNGVVGHKHKRSISIVSIGSDAAGDLQVRTPGRRSTPHSRSTSLSYAPKRSPMIGAFNGMPQSATLPSRKLQSSGRDSAPATHIIEDSLSNFTFSAPRKSPTPRHAANGSLNRSFKFPPSSNTGNSSPGMAPKDSPKPGPRDSIKADGTLGSDMLLPGVANIELVSPAEESNNSASEFEHVPPSKVINSQIMSDDATPRSSLDFYSLPNSTTDTLISDFDAQINQKLLRHTQGHSRRPSLLSGASSARAPEVLMMGYVQVQGSFMLDGSLVQTGSFDEIKRKGIVGGQMGGGVVGIESRKAQNGFLGGLGWSNLSNGFGSSFGGGITNGITNGITSGLGSLITGGNMSSIAEMKNIANSRSIPILSTPQSILFVDLKLAPGESRSYTYTFTLPKQLPPTHRGKAIKVVYNIVIGTQRPGKGVQQPKVIEVPFRVFPHVMGELICLISSRHGTANMIQGNGGLFTYDLMNPIILLKDEAKIKTLDEAAIPLTLGPKAKPGMKKPNRPESSLDEFLQYADKLLHTESSGGHSPGGHTGILSPSITMSRRNSFLVPEQPTAKEAIDFAVTKLQGKTGTSQIFGITRNGKQVANLSLARPAYKLGEAIIAVIDFSNAQIPCYHVNATLETHETVNPALALRSPSSVYRVTRKVHAQHSETCLFSKRITFSPTIPQLGTPEFSTTGVSLSGDASRRGSTPSQVNEMGEVVQGDYFYYQPQRGNEGIMERTQKDDRGQLFTAMQQVWCDGFDCSIPVKVYANDVGAPGGTGVHGGFVV